MRAKNAEENMLKTNFTYLLRCQDNSLYCGWTTNLEERVKTHNEGKGAKYTQCRLPVELVFSESFFSKSEAMKREAEIKNMSRQLKLELIEKYSGIDGQKRG